ncbi:hypothetical protein GR200_20730 [Rhizobium leguminosarum]|uniref:hypothetical protein n=1 Tax=Rhizobium leguminosarum TaxID=384 RepID=UPI0013BCF7D7|nr:hypothetical protein [Rhizobium leguminosarum]NEI57468.1 hypothetical protein [Rhizobium leguminosarum]NEI86328.1 hypothetical protein [Rhizobium leguminosarum]
MADTDFVTALVDTLQTPGAGNVAALKAAVTASVNLASQAEAEAGAENTKPMTAARTKQQIDALKADFAEVVTDTYSLTASDNGKFRVLTDPDGVGLELPNDMPVGFAATYIQGGNGQITFSAEAGGVMHQADGFSHTRKKWSAVTATVLSNAGGSAAVWIVTGDMEE